MVRKSDGGGPVRLGRQGEVDVARRTREQTEALRRQIVEEALRQFADVGVEASAMVGIAREVGISKQALMHHFPNKAALAEAVHDRIQEVSDRVLPKMVAAFTAEDAQIDGIFAELDDVLTSNIDIVRYTLRKMVFGIEMPKPASGDAMVMLMLDFLRRKQDEGTFRRDMDPMNVMFHLSLMFLGTYAAPQDHAARLMNISEEEVRHRRSKELLRIARAALLV
jgi:AcrR family transcriptional regulator